MDTLLSRMHISQRKCPVARRHDPWQPSTTFMAIAIQLLQLVSRRPAKNELTIAIECGDRFSISPGERLTVKSLCRFW